MVDVVNKTTHVLDPLSIDELIEAVRILREDGIGKDRYLFTQVELAEPPKAAVLAVENGSSDGLARIAKAVIIDRVEHRSYEYFVSLDEGTVVDRKRIETGQPTFTMPEIFSIESVLRDDPRFQAAMARRGVTDMSLIWVDPWSTGDYGDETEYAGRRYVRGLVWVMDGAGDDNGYAHPVENLAVLFDLNTQEILRIDDFDPVVPVPQKRGNYRPEDVGELRTDLRPLDITQPEGASFEVNGSLVTWQNWRLRVAFSPREGLVLRTVGWDDGQRVRSILYRGALSEMVVPYGDPALIHARKNTFDVGELNLGALANSLTLGCDCLGEIYYFDAALVDAHGDPYVLKNAICMHEEDFGVLWRHFNWRSGKTEIRRSRRLVVSSFSTIGNYDYGFFWYFYQDGNIECEVKLTGILSTGAIEPGQTPVHGQLLNETGLYGPIHPHFFNFRLDLDIDGLTNSIIEEHGEADPPGPGNPVRSAFRNVKTVLKTEHEAQQLVDPLRGRTWKVINPDVTNAIGEPVGYRLVPSGNVGSFSGADSSIARRATFITKHLWVTPQTDGEIFAAGDYPNQHPGGGGLPTYTAQNRSIEDTDIVVWYTLGSHHQPRPEDWPVMPVAYARFMLMPSGFFDQNPALDLPEPVAHKNGHHCCS
ncbi:MAG: primary-amine oxidase [Thermomicrobiales bacterium]|nr:primary-amine oxidase [Thermomicrobiales bacterium]